MGDILWTKPFLSGHVPQLEKLVLRKNTSCESNFKGKGAYFVEKVQNKLLF